MTDHGLTRVPLAVLDEVLARVEDGRLMCPLASGDLVEAGFTGRAFDLLDVLHDVEQIGVLATLRATIAERRAPRKIW